MTYLLKVKKNSVLRIRHILSGFVIILIILWLILYKRASIETEEISIQETYTEEISTEERISSESKEWPSVVYTKVQMEKIERDKKCYEFQNSNEKIIFLDDVEKSPPKPDKTIFFISTSCINDGLVSLSARDACAVESAASQNPNRDVFVLFLSPVGFIPDEPDSPLIAGLKSFPNIHFRNINYYEFSKNTPAEQWIKEDRIFLSPYVKTQMSDYIRFLTLYKFGGIYFDMDYIVVKSVDGVPPNFAPQENWETINASVLGFASNGTGHGMIDMILRESIEKYMPDQWLHNGPGAVIRGFQRICHVDNPTALNLMRPEFCDGLMVVPQVVFFPLNPKEAILTDPQAVEQALNKVTQETVGIHIWTSHTRNVDILKSGPPMFYTIMAQKFCPKSYEASGLHFNA